MPSPVKVGVFAAVQSDPRFTMGSVSCLSVSAAGSATGSPPAATERYPPDSLPAVPVRVATCCPGAVSQLAIFAASQVTNCLTEYSISFTQVRYGSPAIDARKGGYSTSKFLQVNHPTIPGCIDIIKNLGLLHRPRYIHRGSHQNFVYS